VISPILANLFLHYAFDLWMKREFPDLLWCRYADDGLVHCRTEQEAEAIKAALQARLAECQLEMHPTKTKIVYCKDGKRKGRYPNVMFDFLGYQFRPRMVQNSRDGSLFCSFVPAVSPSALKSMRSTVRDLNIAQRTHLSMDDIAKKLNPLLRVLWPLRVLAAGTHAPTRQLDDQTLGDAKVQALCGASGCGCPLSKKAGQDPRRSVRTLATRHDRSVLLMGAV